MTTLQQDRLNDFKKVLTYHLVTKIKYHFKSNYDAYYVAPSVWAKWRQGKIDYNKVNPYSLIVKFNQTSLSTRQVQHIFGKDEDGKYMSYRELIDSDADITQFNKGTLVVKQRRFGIQKRYVLPYEFIKSIFTDSKLLNAVVDAGSDYYTDRQRRLIFTQINKQRNYHYKTNNELSEEQRIAEIVAGLDMDDIGI